MGEMCQKQSLVPAIRNDGLWPKLEWWLSGAEARSTDIRDGGRPLSRPETHPGIYLSGKPSADPDDGQIAGVIPLSNRGVRVGFLSVGAFDSNNNHSVIGRCVERLHSRAPTAISA
jgi:hypothetical protein